MYFLLTLGYPKKDHLNHEEWSKYGECALQLIDWDCNRVIREVTYTTPGDRRAEGGSIQFKAGSIYKKDFYVPTSTEVIVYELPGLKRRQVYTHPYFNDVHHVVVRNGLMYICNTGLEIIQVMDSGGSVVMEYNAGLRAPERRIRRGIDYRKILTTKPHETHTNFIFFIGEDLWCTRFLQKDAVCITDKSKKIDLNLSRGGPHDGVVRNDFIYFTVTDGFIVIVNKESLKVEELINLNEIYNFRALLGWCRGIEIKGNKAYVGFTALRKSKYREYGTWIKHGKKRLGSRIAEYDLYSKRLIKEMPVAVDTGASIFTVKDVSLFINS